MMEMRDRESWHFDKRVPIATIWVLVVQLIGGVWYASQINAQVNALTAGAAAREARLTKVEAVATAQAVSNATISEQIVGIRESLTDLKSTQKETNTLLRSLKKESP